MAWVKRERRQIGLCLPQTYMNLSGRAVGAVSRYFQVDLQRLLVVVDDADLAFGTVRMRPGGSSGGHHGLESIEQHLGTREYPRLRIGIGRTQQAGREITGHVLGRFSTAERKLWEKILTRATRQAECWVNDGIKAAMNQFNGAVQGPNETKASE